MKGIPIGTRKVRGKAGSRSAKSAVANIVATPDEYKAMIRETWSENDFLRHVINLARAHGFRTAHFRPAMNKRGQWMTAVQGDGAGWPDIILVRPPRILAVELKVGKNKTTPEQDVWLEQLSKCGIYAAVWRPEMWETIETILK